MPRGLASSPSAASRCPLLRFPGSRRSLEEQKSNQRVDLIGSEDSLVAERHAAIDVVPYRPGSRVRRAERQDTPQVPGGDIRSPFGFYQSGSGAPFRCRPVACRAVPPFCTKSCAPSLAVPRPSGSSSPVGLMEISQARISSSLGVLPTPYVGDCAHPMWQTPRIIPSRKSLRKRIVNAPIARDPPCLNAIVPSRDPE